MSSSVSLPRLVIAGAGSGAGKTTAAVGLARALRARGLRVQLFKCGPDYLDPTYHRRASGAASHNLDGWMMGPDGVRRTVARVARDTAPDLAIVEGMMGLFDGVQPESDAGSTAEIARWLQAPVLLLIDAAAMARTFAAVVQGLAGYDPALRVAGAIANRVGGRGHLELLARAGGCVPLLGGLPDDAAGAFPERHLGLRSADHAALPEHVFEAWGETVAAWWDLDAVLAIARAAPALGAADDDDAPAAPRRCRIGLAFDDAFHFYYDDNLRRLERLGAELVRFSPLRDGRLPEVDGLYIGGGYPEAHAAALAANGELRAAIARFAAGHPVYGECGGLMYLAERLRTGDGIAHPMVGALPGEAVMGDRLAALGYVEVELRAPSPLGAPGLRFRGHEFRHSTLLGAEAAAGAYTLQRGAGQRASVEGYRRGGALGSYVHAHWASNPQVAEAFVRSCAAAARAEASP